MIKCSYCDRQVPCDCRNMYCHKCGKITNGSQKDDEKGHLDFWGMDETTTTTDVERILKYFEKIRMSEIIFCEDHDREFLKGEECPGCQSERDDREIEACVSSSEKDD